MSKDYVKAKSKIKPVRSRTGYQRYRKNKSEKKLWLLAASLFILLVSGLLFLQHEGTRMSQNQPLKSEKKLASKPKEVETHPLPQPRFDFYTMLPSEKVSNPVAATTPAASKKTNDESKTTLSPPASARTMAAAMVKQQLEGISKPASPSTKMTTRYYIQVGIYHDFSKADEQKAALVLQGIETKIKTIKKNEETWYRVCLGPFKTTLEATKMQQKLKGAQIASSLKLENN